MPWTQPLWSPGQWRSWAGRERGKARGGGGGQRPREGCESQVCCGAPLLCPLSGMSLSSPQPFTVYVSPSNLVPSRVCPQLSIYS